MAHVRLHGAYIDLAGNVRELTLEGLTVRAVLAALVRECPLLTERIRDEHGRLRDHLSLFVRGRDVRELDGEDTVVGAEDTVHLIPALSGG